MRPDDDLDPEQREFLERLAAPLRRPVELSDRVERKVLARLRTGAGPVPRPSLRPLVAAALAAGIAAVFAIGVLVGRRSSASSALDRGPRTVEFVLRTAADSAVTLVGDFNDWNPRATPLHPGSDGVWTVTVPLRPGRYRYTFIVDGSWRQDPAAPRALEDDFGTPTSVITIAQR
jgi:hypothetical protein